MEREPENKLSGIKATFKDTNEVLMATKDIVSAGMMSVTGGRELLFLNTNKAAYLTYIVLLVLLASAIYRIYMKGIVSKYYYKVLAGYFVLYFKIGFGIDIAMNATKSIGELAIEHNGTQGYLNIFYFTNYLIFLMELLLMGGMGYFLIKGLPNRNTYIDIIFDLLHGVTLFFAAKVLLMSVSSIMDETPITAFPFVTRSVRNVIILIGWNLFVTIITFLLSTLCPTREGNLDEVSYDLDRNNLDRKVDILHGSPIQNKPERDEK